MESTSRPSGRLAGVSAMFDGGRLTLARQLAGLKKINLAALTEMPPAPVPQWKNETKNPTGPAFPRLSVAPQVEPQFFAPISAATPLPAAPHFRSLRSTTQLA